MRLTRAARPRGALRFAAGRTSRFTTPRAARTLPTHVAVEFGPAHLHPGPVARTEFCTFDAPIVARGFLDPFGQALQAKKPVASKKAAEEAGQVRPRAGCVLGLHCTASDTSSCVDWQQPFHSRMSAPCTTLAMRLRARSYIVSCSTPY